MNEPEEQADETQLAAWEDARQLRDNAEKKYGPDGTGTRKLDEGFYGDGY